MNSGDSTIHVAKQWRHGAEEEEGGEGEGEGAAARELRSTVLQREQ